MAITNLLTIEFSEAELSKINSALMMLEETFAGKLIRDNGFDQVNINELEIENISAIPSDEGTLFLTSIPAFSNINQWDKDEKAREQLNPIASRLKTIAQQVVNTNRAVLLRCWNSSSKY